MASLNRGRSFVESLVGDSGALKNLFAGNPKAKKELDRSPSGNIKNIKELSPLANIVVSRCCRVLTLQPEDLQQHFEDEASEHAKHPSKYARNLLEYACFKALSVATQVSDHIRDKEFPRLVFDMMLAWETPGAANKPSVKKENGEGDTAEEDDDEEDSALFYSDLMPMMVDVETTVGQEAFARLAPVIPLAADTISVYQQFEALTASTGGRLPFPIFEKYFSELDKSVRNIKGQVTPNLVTSLKLAKGETVIEIDGTATTQPVLQHVGVSTWPGRLTLTSQALYFEAIGVVSYDKPKKFDLSADLKHVVKPDLTGPWGARLFDKAVMYKSSATVDPIVLEFPELTGRSRRDYWLAIIREIVAVHRFNRTFRLGSGGKAESISKAVLGVARLRATREIFHALPQRPESLLTFSYADAMPGGDIVLKTLAEQLQTEQTSLGESLFGKYETAKVLTPTAVSTLSSLGSPTSKGTSTTKDEAIVVGEVLIGEPTALEKAVLHSRDNNKKAEMAKATIDGVKVDGIGTNIAVMKELLLPVVTFATWIQALIAWEDPVKSFTFTIISGYIIYRNWVCYIIPIILLSATGYNVWLRRQEKGNHFDEVVVISPPSQNAMEQLIALQQALAQFEGLLQSGNIGLLKFRALCLSVLPQPHSQMTNGVIAGIVVVSLFLALFPFRIIFLILFLELFTRNMYLRRETSDRWIRRAREWWYSVPAVPVRFVKPDDEG
ncbi:unnamed protein product [Calypogeia fissa]